MYLSVVYVENNTDCRYYGLSGAPKLTLFTTFG